MLSHHSVRHCSTLPSLKINKYKQVGFFGSGSVVACVCVCGAMFLECSSRDRFSAEFSSARPGNSSPLSPRWQRQGYVWQWPRKDKAAMGGFLRYSAEALLCFSRPQAKNNDSPPCC